MKNLSDYLNESLNESIGYDAAEKALIKDLKERNKKEHADISDDDILDIANALMDYYGEDRISDYDSIKTFLDDIAGDIRKDEDDWLEHEKLKDYVDVLKKIYK